MQITIEVRLGLIFSRNLDHMQKLGSVIAGYSRAHLESSRECQYPNNIRKKPSYIRQPDFLSEYLMIIVPYESDTSILVLVLFDMSVVYYLFSLFPQ